MTTYVTAYTLVGDEVLVYRRMLEILAIAVKEKLEGIEAASAADGFPADALSDMARGGTKRKLDLIEQLISNTYSCNGENATEVQETLDTSITQSLLEIMDIELHRIRDKSSADILRSGRSRDLGSREPLRRLQEVRKKLGRFEMASTFRP
jgi:hypothetical protein